MVAGGLARYLAEESGLPGAAQGPQDALRHCLWNCLTVAGSMIEGGETQAAANGTAAALDRRETPGVPSDDQDLHNNRVGRRCGRICGRRGGNYIDCCIDKCWGMLASGFTRSNRLPPPPPGDGPTTGGGGVLGPSTPGGPGSPVLGPPRYPGAGADQTSGGSKPDFSWVEEPLLIMSAAYWAMLNAIR